MLVDVHKLPVLIILVYLDQSNTIEANASTIKIIEINMKSQIKANRIVKALGRGQSYQFTPFRRGLPKLVTIYYQFSTVYIFRLFFNSPSSVVWYCGRFLLVWCFCFIHLASTKRLYDWLT